MSARQKPAIGVIGAGPIGVILAAKLTEAGCRVALCVRNEVKRSKITENGLVLTNVFNLTATVEVCEKISDFASLDLDYLIFATKSYQVRETLQEAADLNSEKLSVVIAQNGIDIEGLFVPAFGESKILRMVVNFAGSMISPNTVKVTFFNGKNYIGSINDSKAGSAQRLAGLLSSAALDTEATDSFSLTKQVWQKTILNAALSPLCGVSRLTMAEAMNDPDSAELVEQMISEGVEVAEKEKIKFSDDFIRMCMRYLKRGGDHFPSLALDLIHEKPTEIDYFNGKIVEYGRKHYVRTSLNLSFTNTVKAMTNKNIISRVPGEQADVFRLIIGKGILNKQAIITTYKNQNCFLGIDLGSAYAKLSVIDEEGSPVFQYFLPTMTSDKQTFKNVMTAVASNFRIKYSCATGYGRKHFTDTDIVKTEINCAAAGVSYYFSGEKNIIDIGGEDIKVIRCDQDNNVENFYMNDKCAAGTGSFLAEITERASIDIAEMSSLAALSKYDKELNSFCTVFAKTEIMNWIFDGMKIEDIARGIYISIANRVAKMRLDPGIPTYMIGGVIAHHPFLKNILNEKFNKDIQIVQNPQFMVAFGAATIARSTFQKQQNSKLKAVTT